MSSAVSALNFVDSPKGLELTFRSATKQAQSWSKEVELAALKIRDVAQKPIWVCLSGGIDSELICHIFLKLKIPFQVLTIEHLNGGNRNDTVWAQKWCQENNVLQKIVSFDTDKFFAEFIPSRLKTGFYSPCPFRFFQLFLMETIESFGGFGVLGVGEQRYFYDSVRSEAYLELDSGLNWVQQFASDRHVPFFFYSTPEIMLSYSPQVRVSLDHPEIFAHKENIFLMKRMVYQTYFPHLKTREKLDGWEKVALEFAVARSRLQKQAAGRPQYFRISASELESQLHCK